MPYDNEDDICRRKHGGNTQSNIANRRTDKIKDRARIYAYIWSQGLKGITRDQIEMDLNMTRSTVTSRVSEMKKDGSVTDTAETRPTRTGCPAAVVVATVHLRQSEREQPAPQPKPQPKPFASFG